MFKRAVLLIFILTLTESTDLRAQLSVLTTNDFVPGTSNRFRDFSPPRINNEGIIVFHASATVHEQSGIYLADDGRVTPILRYTELAPDGNGTVNNLFQGTSDLYNSTVSAASNQVFFAAGLLGTQSGGSDDTGLFLYDGTNFVIVAREGQTASGLTLP